MTLGLSIYLFICGLLMMTSVTCAIKFVGPVSRVNIHAEQVQFSQIWEYFPSNFVWACVQLSQRLDR